METCWFRSRTMRDIALTLIFFSFLPFVFARPYIGIYIWTWLSLMNPHRLTYGFAFTFPFAQITAIVTLISMLASKEPKANSLDPGNNTVAGFYPVDAVYNLFRLLS